MPAFSRIHWPIFWTLLVTVGYGLLLFFNDTAREVTFSTCIALFTFFSTPFILEASSIGLFILGLLTYNQWRRHKDGDDWVYLVTQEPEPGEVGSQPTLTQRLQSTVFTEKPELPDDIETDINLLEGYLELGMPAQALAELHKLPDDLPVLNPLRLRILAANLQTEEALDLLQKTIDEHPDTRPLLVQTALENARWLLHHLQRRDLARVWLTRAQALHPLKLSADDPLAGLLRA